MFQIHIIQNLPPPSTLYFHHHPLLHRLHLHLRLHCRRRRKILFQRKRRLLRPQLFHNFWRKLRQPHHRGITFLDKLIRPGHLIPRQPECLPRNLFVYLAFKFEDYARDGDSASPEIHGSFSRSHTGLLMWGCVRTYVYISPGKFILIPIPIPIYIYTYTYPLGGEGKGGMRTYLVSFSIHWDICGNSHKQPKPHPPQHLSDCVFSILEL